VPTAQPTLEPTASQDCTGTWSDCDANCERTWSPGLPQIGAGAACPEAPSCSAGEDECAPQIGQDIIGQWRTQSGRTSLSLNGKILAVGAPGATSGGQAARGQVRIFSFQDDTQSWEPMGNIIWGEHKHQRSGGSVSLSSDGKTVARGAFKGKVDIVQQGTVGVFKFHEGQEQWQLLGHLIAGKGRFHKIGSRVSLSGNGLVVAYTPKPAVYAFHEAENQWIERGDMYALFGNGGSPSLSEDGSIVAFGNGGQGANYVKVYAWDQDNNQWSQMGETITHEKWNDATGQGVSLSADGHTIAVGSPWYDITPGHHQENYGCVRVFSFQDGSWQQIGNKIVGEAEQNKYGGSISLSADGTSIAIGAANKARIFTFNNVSGEWEKTAQVDGEGGGVSLSGDGTTLAQSKSGWPNNYASKGLTRVYAWGYSSGSHVGNGAHVGSCSGSSFGTLEWAQTQCDADPTCTWLHDHACNDNGWRYCSGAFPSGTGDGLACTFKKNNPQYIPPTSSDYPTSSNVGNSAHSGACSGSVGSLEWAKLQCDGDAECSWLHDYDCDGNAWRYCSGAFPSEAGDGLACTMTKPESESGRRALRIDSPIVGRLLQDEA